MFLEKTEWYLFLLAALMIGAVYYVGVKTDAGAFSAVFNSGYNTIIGKGSTGNSFAQYPNKQ